MEDVLVNPGRISKATAALHAARRKAMGKAGGRKFGSVGIKKRAQIKTEEQMIEAIKSKTGFIVQDLVINSSKGDTKASLGLLDRAYGKATERATVDVNMTFNLYDIQKRREMLDGNKDIVSITSPRILEALPDALDSPTDNNITPQLNEND